MKMLDLFSGIGGFSLAAQWVWGKDLEIVSFAECDEFCQKILKKHWPDIKIHNDIRNFDGKEWQRTVDLLTGGFPCQDVSIADPNCFGLKGNRSGLWKEMLRIISNVRPKYAIVENVPGLKRWLGEILGDLARIGFDAQWHSIPASAIGAPHKRERMWIVAYPANKSGLQAHSLAVSIRKNLDARCSISGLYWREMASPDWAIPDRWLTGGDDGLSRRLVCRAYGNAIVPQVAEVIMQAIKKVDGI